MVWGSSEGINKENWGGQGREERGRFFCGCRVEGGVCISIVFLVARGSSRGEGEFGLHQLLRSWGAGYGSPGLDNWRCLVGGQGGLGPGFFSWEVGHGSLH